jgi:phosphoesterase RecJ-like protein
MITPHITQELLQAIRQSRRLLIATHVNPDGDAVGSMAALAHIALHLDTEVRLYLPRPLPVFLSWLPLPAPVTASLPELSDWRPDLLALVDCADAGRVGPELAPIVRSGKGLGPDSETPLPLMIIDHHVSNVDSGALSWVSPDSAASGELVGLLAMMAKMPLSGALGQALYLALASDTGNFTYSNTSAECLEMAARIVRDGLNVGDFTDKYENNWNLERMHLWGRLMSEISLRENGAVAVSVVPRKYLDDLGLGKADLEGFASWLRRIDGVRVALFVREDKPNQCKISLRSMGDVDVSAVTARFGGGGHVAAAGAELSLPPQETVETVLAALREQLNSKV